MYTNSMAPPSPPVEMAAMGFTVDRRAETLHREAGDPDEQPDTLLAARLRDMRHTAEKIIAMLSDTQRRISGSSRERRGEKPDTRGELEKLRDDLDLIELMAGEVGAFV